MVIITIEINIKTDATIRKPNIEQATETENIQTTATETI